MIEQMAISIPLPEFIDLGRSATPNFLLIDHFSIDFLRLAKNEENLSIKMHYRIVFFLALRLSVLGFQMPLKWLRFEKILLG